MPRWSWLCVLALAACDSPPDEGAVLTFETPDGTLAATRLEVVLANAAPTAISDIDNQRQAPGDDAADAVRYYRQRAVGGTIALSGGGGGALAGFQLRIEPDASTSTDEAFIPFVFAYDQDRLVGVGTIDDANGDPAPAQIMPGVTTAYTITMMPVAEVPDADAVIGRGSARVVTCAGAADPAKRWTSGVAWFPVADPARPSGRAHQLRLLLPDRGADPAATDATERAADLDCDAHSADESDCDDLRGAFYRGAAESCDGLDTNCDSQRYIAQSCNAQASCPLAASGNGVQLCDDEAGTLGACTPSAECACAPGSGLGCTSCYVDFLGASTTAKAACSPSVGKISLPMCTDAPCTVEVAAATNDWRAFVGTTDSGGFGGKATNVHGVVFLEVKRGTTLPATTAGIGEVYLLVTTAQASTLVPVLLRMNTELSACRPAANGNASLMTCSP